MTHGEYLSSCTEKFGIKLSEKQVSQFKIYGEFLTEYNEKVNLTRITDPFEIMEKHFADSALPLSMTEIKEGAKVIDVGTGAGFPGVPMKIVRPDIELTLLDSLNKRLLFLKELSDKLGIEATLIHSRAEVGGIDPLLREKYDVAVSRAVAKLSVLCEYCLPYVRVGGKFMALKGPELENELKEAQNAVKLLGGRVCDVKEYSLPCGDGRTLVVIEKEFPTPKKYPRQRVKLNERPL